MNFIVTADCVVEANTFSDLLKKSEITVYKVSQRTIKFQAEPEGLLRVLVGFLTEHNSENMNEPGVDVLYDLL